MGNYYLEKVKKMSENKIKAVLYARVSTEEQATEGYNAQKELLNEFAHKHNFEIIDEYIDEGKSGKNIEGRPEMKRLLKDAKNENFNAVIVYKLDRLSRKTKDSLEIVEVLEFHNIQLISYSETSIQTHLEERCILPC